MKTPDEIKKRLERCANDAMCSEKCPYFNSLSNGVDCASQMHADALALIQQLERERDAAVNDLAEARDCKSCKHLEEKEELNAHYDIPSQCINCRFARSQYLWRGLCKENGGAEDGQDHSD